MLNSESVRLVQRLRQQREDPVVRITALRKQMMLWLFSTERRNEAPREWSGFLQIDSVHFPGNHYTKPEIVHEVEYLVSRELITTNIRVDDEVYGWFYPRLTADGRDCVTDHGGSVSDFLRSRNGGATYQFSDNSGAISVNSTNVTQSVRHGVETASLLKFAQAAAQMLPVLNGIPGNEKDELHKYAATVEAEISQPEPDVGKLRELFTALYTGVMKASSTVATDMLVGLGHEASKALGIGV